jgi:hypothetical protein
VLCIIVSVAVAFWYILHIRLFSVLCIVMKWKFILLLCSFSCSCSFLVMLLNSRKVRFMSVNASLYISSTSSAYLK